MSSYEESYYIIFRDYELKEYNNKLVPTPKTANRDWEFEKLNFDLEPLEFLSKNSNLNFLKKGMGIAFAAPHFVVTDKLKNCIDFGLYGSQFYPASVYDSKGNVVEGLWALNTFRALDCLDVKQSNVYLPDNEVTDIGGFDVMPDVDVYHFDKGVLDSIPEDERLIFQIDNTTIAEFFFHQRVVDIFKKNNVKGVNFFKVSEFKSGDEF